MLDGESMTEFGFLFGGILLGIFINRYLMAFGDLLVELTTFWFTKLSMKLQSQVEIIKFKTEEYCSPKQPAIGFTMDGEELIEFDIDDDDDEGSLSKIESKAPLGFRM